MVAKSKHVYRTQDNELQYILNSISDRLDKLEGLRGSLSDVIARTISIDGTFVPTLTFQQPGDLAVTYSFRVGRYTKVGNRVTAQIAISSTLTHTTAQGALRVSGLPFTSKDTTGAINVGSVSWDGITKAGYTQVTPVIINNVTYIEFYASGSAQNINDIEVADVPTGGSVSLYITISYETEPES